MKRGLKLVVVSLLLFLTSFRYHAPTYADTVNRSQSTDESCDYKPSAMGNPDYQTINCLLTEIALEYDVPPEIVKAIAWNESNWQQFDENGDPIISDDGGIGIMQITNQSDYDEEKLKNDLLYNIRAGVEILESHFKRTDLPTINDKNRDFLENWYFAIMAYNGTKPVNSPVIQEAGERNKNAYQEKIYETIKTRGLLETSPLTFSKEDFEYDPNSSENIQFVTMQYYFDMPLTKTKHNFVKGQKAATTAKVNLRERPTTSSNRIQTLEEGEIVKITGSFQFDENITSENQFVWYPVETADGKKGYVASAYLDYRFKDVPLAHYSEEAIYDLYNRGILYGIGNDSFGFGQNLTREQAAILLVRVNHLSLDNRPDPGFSDVPKNYPYYKAIAAAVDEGYFKGISENTFDPKGTFTRGMMATVLQRVYNYPEAKESHPFKDVDSKAWYADAVARLYAANITEGISDDQFGPNNPVTREQFAVFLKRVIK